MAVLKVYLLGGFRLLYGEAVVTTINTPRLQALLAYLTLHRHAPQPRSHLAFLFWPDSTEAQARTNLRYLLHQLRHALPQISDFLEAGDGALQWRADAPFTLDVADFEQAVVRADQAGDPAEVRPALEQAVTLYQGDLLPSGYDDWLLAERERLSQMFITALERLILLVERQRDYRIAISYTQRLLRHDPLHEEAYRHLMRLHAANGDRVSALRIYHTCTAVLQRELAVEPSAAIREEYERLLHKETPAGPGSTSEAASLHPPVTPPNNLPIQLTSFVGREREMAEIKHLLTGTRLLTLTGPGGCGKSRLALEVAADLHQSQEVGERVWWVELAALADPAFVVETVAAALEVQEQPGRQLKETLLDYLRPKNLLLALDNCEHLVAACAQFVEGLIRACPRLKVLATSREPLSIAGETTWLTPSLSVPDTSLTFLSEAAVADLNRYEAVRLFIERAVATLPTFTLTSHNAALVVQICRRLDGIPLAIELAAARVKVLTLPQITARLDDAFKLLTTGTRALVSRHQTLKATIDWSYDLLSEPERVLFHRLAVFEGGFTLEATEAVCAEDGLEPDEMLELLSHLVDKSLIVVSMPQLGQEARYRLLETVRQYGRDKLIESGEADMMRQQHAAYYLALAEQAERKLQGLEQSAWLARLELDHDNLRAVLRWSQIEARYEEPGLRLSGALGLFWYMHSHWSEGRGWVEAILTHTQGSAHKPARAKALLVAGTLAHYQGDYKQAALHLDESLALYRELGDNGGTAWSLFRLGHTADRQGHYERAAALLGDSVMLFRQSADKWGAALSLCILGWVTWHLDDYELAAVFCQESLTLSQGLGNPRGIAWALYCLGGVAMAQGDFVQAVAFSQESLALFRQLGIKDGMALALHTLGYVALFQSDYGSAASSFGESLVLRQELGDKVGLAHGLAGLAAVAGAQGQAIRAVRLFSATGALLDRIDASLEPIDRAAYNRNLVAVHALLSGAAFETTWMEGQTMSQEQAITEALRVASELNPTKAQDETNRPTPAPASSA